MQADRAVNGREALNMVLQRLNENEEKPCICEQRRENYKIIFMDCNMPIMDGLQATTEIRRRIPRDLIKIAALTAYTTEGFEKKCFQAGMDVYLTKPISEDKIKNILHEIQLISTN